MRSSGTCVLRRTEPQTCHFSRWKAMSASGRKVGTWSTSWRRVSWGERMEGEQRVGRGCWRNACCKSSFWPHTSFFFNEGVPLQAPGYLFGIARKQEGARGEGDYGVIRVSLGRRLVNLVPVAQRANALTNGVVDRKRNCAWNHNGGIEPPFSLPSC